MKISQEHLHAFQIAQLQSQLAQSECNRILAALSFQYGKDLSNVGFRADGTVVDGSVDGSSTDAPAGSDRESSVEEVRRDGPGSP